MWSQIISSSSQTTKMVISPSDDYCLMTIFLPCPEVVIISYTHCIDGCRLCTLIFSVGAAESEREQLVVSHLRSLSSGVSTMFRQSKMNCL